MEDVLMLFEEETNFIVDETGVVTIILKTVVKNRYKEINIPLQLNPYDLQKLQQREVAQSTFLSELKTLKETISILEKKVDSMGEFPT